MHETLFGRNNPFFSPTIGKRMTLTLDDTPPPPENHAPQVTSFGVPFPSETCFGHPITLVAQTFDEDGDAISFTFNFGDNTPEVETSVDGGGDRTLESQVQHTYAAPGTYTVFVNISDGRGGTDGAETTVFVGAPPVITSLAAMPNPACVGDYVSFMAHATHESANPLAFTWNFGDGSAEETTTATGAGELGSAVNHVYTAAGVYTARVTVTDEECGSVARDVIVTVIGAQISCDNIFCAESESMARITVSVPGHPITLESSAPASISFEPATISDTADVRLIIGSTPSNEFDDITVRGKCDSGAVLFEKKVTVIKTTFFGTLHLSLGEGPQTFCPLLGVERADNFINFPETGPAEKIAEAVALLNKDHPIKYEPATQQVVSSIKWVAGTEGMVPGGKPVVCVEITPGSKTGKTRFKLGDTACGGDILVMQVKIADPFPMKNKLLATGSYTLTANLDTGGAPAPSGLWSWSYPSGSFAPVGTPSTTFTAGTDLTNAARKDQDIVRVFFSVNGTSHVCSGQRPLNITAPRLFSSAPANGPMPPFVSKLVKSNNPGLVYAIKILPDGEPELQVIYSVFDQFGDSILESEVGGKRVEVREDVTFSGWLPVADLLNKETETQKDWRPLSELSGGTNAFKDRISLPIPIRLLTNPNLNVGKFRLVPELRPAGSLVVEMSGGHVWHASINGNLDISFTNNICKITVKESSYRPNSAYDEFRLQADYNIQVSPRKP